MNKTLRAYLNNEMTSEHWTQLFGMPRYRISMIRSAAAMPRVDEIRAIAGGCGARPSVVSKELRLRHTLRWAAIDDTLRGQEPQPYLTGRQGRAPRV